MPPDVTIFAAKYLVFIACACAAVVIPLLARRRSQRVMVRWALAAAAMLVLSYALAQVAGALYTDPRPFVTEHTRPLVAHAPDNGFPSDHALLSAALAALVGLLSPTWAVLFVVLAVLVDWARVGAGLHHPVDVLGSSLGVAIATLCGILLARVLAERVAALLPDIWPPPLRSKDRL